MQLALAAGDAALSHLTFRTASNLKLVLECGLPNNLKRNLNKVEFKEHMLCTIFAPTQHRLLRDL